jgi:hypothetical protein
MNLKTLDGGMMMYKRQSVRKKECYKHLRHHKSDKNIQKYQKARRNTKKVVSEVMDQAYAELYHKLRIELL